MTEEEAKAKWCPFSMATTTLRRDGIEGSHFAISAANRQHDGSIDGSRCIASACMAWRETKGEWTSPNYTADEIAAATKPEDVNATWHMHGFCGLAGAPS